jgi:hypothetical protein
MKTLLVTFGDSWTFGSELNVPSAQNWTFVVGEKLGMQTLNLSCPASSIGHLGVQLFQYIEQSSKYSDYKKVFMVGLTGTTRYLSYSNTRNEFVNITPEANYRTGDIHQSGRPPEVVREFSNLSGEMYRLVECPEYNRYLTESMLLMFQSYCSLHDIEVIFFSYFDFLSLKTTVTDNYYPESITKTLTGAEYQLPEIRANQYFTGKLFHPNALGHERIAEVLIDFYDRKYTRN